VRGVAAIALLAACSFQLPRPNDNTGDDGGGGDDDAPGDSGVCGWPYVPEYYDPCTLPAPDPALDLAMAGLYQYNTTTGVLTDPLFQMSIPPSTDGAVRQLLVSGFTLGATSQLRVTGSKPLLVISTSTITIDGDIDASSAFNGIDFDLGAGANPAVCPLTPPEKGQTCAAEGGSGGGAGAYGAAGGSGGEGGDTHSCDGVDGKPGGAGGVAATSGFASLRGGCAGRDGAPSTQVGSDGKIGRGAPGGGAVYLSARTMVTVTGVIHAGGAGGRASQGGRAGGGGGGSGGMIGLEAQTVLAMTGGILAANGGAGGGGADGNIASPGDDAKPSAAVANGGKREGAGSDGGDGGFVTTPFGQSAPGADRGGGGGGGSVGVVHLHARSLDIAGATISPAPQ